MFKFENTELISKQVKDDVYVRASDVAKALGYKNPPRDAGNIINENKDKFEGFSIVTKMVTNQKSGKVVERNTLCLNRDGVMIFCMMSKMPKATQFQRWAAKALIAHIDASVARKSGKYGEITDKSIAFRKLETEEWKRMGAQGFDYKDLTLYEYELLGFEESKRKGDLTPDEIIKLALSNITNVYRLRKHEDRIYKKGIEFEMCETSKMIDNIDSKKDSIGAKTASIERVK